MERPWPALLRSTTARFILLLFLAQIAVMGGMLLLVLQASRAEMIREQKMLVTDLRDELVAGYRHGGRSELAALITGRLNQMRSDVPVILLAAADGSLIRGNLEAWPTIIPDRTAWREINLYRAGNDRPELMGIMSTVLSDGSRLLTGHVIDANLRLTGIIEEAMAGVVLLGVILTLCNAMILSRIMTGPIDAVVATTAAVGAGDLSRRVVTSGSGDAFDALGEAINTMLDRIETLVSELRIITDGLAHDLRSPLTRAKSVLERAIVETDDPVALAALESVSREAESLLEMLSTALQISRMEAGIGRDRFVETDIREMLLDLVDLYGPLAEDQGFDISAGAPRDLVVSLHRELVSQAIGNLIENALKYAAGGHNIRLTARQNENVIHVAVADDGPGIPNELRADARRRFGRLDPARQKTGSGL
ncbi:MAG: sensor histidine kinase, partial [Rhizorhabdus sp.]|nr:sensor histidine kinase [Rhizorhabdus sp.]